MLQVFVFNKKNYQIIKDTLKKTGITNVSRENLADFFSPYYADHMGSILVASGNKSVANWATSVLRNHYYVFTYPSLLKIHGELKRKFESTKDH